MVAVFTLYPVRGLHCCWCCWCRCARCHRPPPPPCFSFVDAGMLSDLRALSVLFPQEFETDKRALDERWRSELEQAVRAAREAERVKVRPHLSSRLFRVIRNTSQPWLTASVHHGFFGRSAEPFFQKNWPIRKLRAAFLSLFTNVPFAASFFLGKESRALDRGEACARRREGSLLPAELDARTEDR